MKATETFKVITRTTQIGKDEKQDRGKGGRVRGKGRVSGEGRGRKAIWVEYREKKEDEEA